MDQSLEVITEKAIGTAEKQAAENRFINDSYYRMKVEFHERSKSLEQVIEEAKKKADRGRIQGDSKPDAG